MNDATTKFVIPQGTRIHTRNVLQDLRMRPHITRKELSFEDRANTGDGGSLFYFQHGDWLISVHAALVQNGPIVFSDLPTANTDEQQSSVPLATR